MVVHASKDVSSDIPDAFEWRGCWDWGALRPGFFAPAGEQSSINRYMIDFQTWEQVNIDNGRRRSVRLDFLHRGKADAEWNGQIDGKL